jgi:UPF0755 protein
MVASFFRSLLPLLALLVVLGACNGELPQALYLEANRARLEEPAGPDRPVTFVVEPGTPARVIARNLEAAGLIADARLFEAYVRVSGLAEKLEAGTFVLSPAMTPLEIAAALQEARAPGLRLTIPEGWRLEEVAAFLDAQTPLSGQEYLILTADAGLHAARYAFLAAAPAGATLEGYLFPDTYELAADQPMAAVLVQYQLDRFAERVVPVYQAAVTAGTTTLTLHQVLTLASIVEREAIVPEERPVIAGVFLNRLARGMKLEADPTVQYALGYQPDSGRWWKTPLSAGDTVSVISPYNTYLYPGLPPGPIAGPGLSSIEAVLAPAGHDFLYFVALPDGSGRHAFSRTFDEHLQNVRRYYGGP